MRKKIIDMDIAGMIASGLCALHCLALPFLLMALPLAGFTFIGNMLWEIIFLGTAVLIGMWSILRSVRVHGKKLPAVLLFMGLLVLVLGKSFTEHSHGLFEAESILSFAGGIVVVLAHTINYRYRSHHPAAEESPTLEAIEA